MTGSNERAYRAGVAVAVLTSFLTVWTTIVRDDGTGIGWFLLVMTAVVGAFAAWFKPAGMARAMLGVAVMQALLGALIGTGLQTPTTSGSVFVSGVFTALWLLSAGSFLVASKERHAPAAAH